MAYLHKNKGKYDSKHAPTWCPGCGNFAIWIALKKALDNLGIPPHKVLIVYGIEVDGVHKAYRHVDLKEVGSIDDTVNGVVLRISIGDDGVVDILAKDGRKIIKERDMWFAWYAFHPETLLYE